VGELDLDLDAFEGPFDLLLTLVLRDELPLREVDLAEVVVAFVASRFWPSTAEPSTDAAPCAAPSGPVQSTVPSAAASAAAPQKREILQADLDACGEFLVLISALLELKARGLFPDEDAELAELEPEAAAEELARRLAEYRRAKEGAAWLGGRLVASRDRFFRLGPAPLAPEQPAPAIAPQPPSRLADAIRALAVEPPALSTAHMALEFPPVARFLERWRSLLRRRSRLDFDQETAGLSRVEVAVAFLAVLELAKAREIAVAQAAPFAPIRISRPSAERSLQWTAHSA